MVSNCVFCRISSGEESANLICRDDLVMAIADIRPIRPGHALIISHAHHAYFDDLPSATASGIIHLGQRLAKIMKPMFGVARVSFLFSGADHAHAHAHVIPMHEKTDVTSRRYIVEKNLTFRPAPRAADEELARTAAELRAALEA